MNSQKFNIGFLGLAGKFFIENGFLNYSHPYGKSFRIRTDDIETVIVDTAGTGEGELKIIGKGTELAKVKMLTALANGCQEWILSQLSSSSNS
ncbi:MAG: hypothetical protein PHI66_05015 [Candidatus Pacebacteria bacterium]|nr:hypothetical protein [Candidatus Paceibacterota bacterium]